MRTTGNRWQRRRQGFHYLVAAIAALGSSLILASLWPHEWSWGFAVGGFLAFVALSRHALILWNVDELVFEPRGHPGAASTIR
jgi:hypothetical protein